MKQKIQKIIILSALACVFCANSALALNKDNSGAKPTEFLAVNAPPITGGSNNTETSTPTDTTDYSKISTPGGVETTVLTGESASINGILNIILVTLTAGAAVLATGSIVVAGIMYMTAGSNSGQVQKAKTMIFNTIIGIIVYLFMWTILEWLIPGGVL